MVRRSVAITVSIAAAAAACGLYAWRRTASPPPAPAATLEAAIDKFCAGCHRFPAPDTLPRESWDAKIKLMYALADGAGAETLPARPSMDLVSRWYVERAPEALPLLPPSPGVNPGAFRWESIPLKLRDVPPYPASANVQFVHLFDDKRLDILVCEMRFGYILAMQPYLQLARTLLLGKVSHPCHAAVVDLDQDGSRDILVADLGTVTPSDVLNGSIVWMRGAKSPGFKTVPLATGLGRVADVQAADFDGDHDLDLVAAVFGWRSAGEVLYLENQTIDYSQPRFERYTLDPRPGAIHVPVADLNGDGRPDFVALISQQFETVVAFLNAGRGRFDRVTLFEGPHPGWGSSSIELVDLDRDGDLDVLLANGDTLDDLNLKPFHGITWLENRGQLVFRAQALSSLYGVHRARAGDLDGDADLDIAACVYLPFVKPGHPQWGQIDSIVWLEQEAPGRFVRRSLEASAPVHPSLDVGDFDADGDADVAVGNMTMAKGDQDTLEHWVLLLRSQVRRE